MKITKQGAPRVNTCIIHAEGEKVVALAIDLHSKRCEIMATGGSEEGPEIHISANEESLHLDETKSKDSWTTVAFPEYPSWRIWAAESTRYTIAICLVKE